jgi:hypothetical protein
MRLLPAEQRTFSYENGVVIAGLHERDGYRCYSVFELRDGQSFAGRDDGESLVVHEIHRPAALKH